MREHRVRLRAHRHFRLASVTVLKYFLTALKVCGTHEEQPRRRRNAVMLAIGSLPQAEDFLLHPFFQ